MQTLSTKTIFLIEDNAGDARLLREMLKDERWADIELVHVQTMDEAERRLAHTRCDIILLDLGLPDTQGLEAVRRVRVAAPRTPLVVLTGLDDESMAEHSLKEGAQDYLIKGDVDSRALIRALRHAIERTRLDDALFVEREQAQAMAELVNHSAHHDFLTSLPNRMLMNERIVQAIVDAGQRQQPLALLFLDLDGFKHINDSLGHSVGDKLLQSVADRLLACLRGVGVVSRQGGDEFIVLLPNLDAGGVSAIAKQLLATIAIPHAIDGNDIHVTTSIGVSLYPTDGLDAETLIKNADTAMYHAKDNGRQNTRFFKPAMSVMAKERQSIEESLRTALQRQEFSLHYQPKVDLGTGAITGAEALIRWTHPVRGPLAPGQFIPIAEACGLILPISRWVLREACRQAQAWIAAGLPPITMAVNVSALDFQDETFLEYVYATLAETGLAPALLELEMTESVLMKRADETEALLRQLRRHGVRLAVDDFGTGYSSLSYLSKFSIDTLKIDQSFIRQLSNEPDANSIVMAMISMGRSLKLSVIAEGVERLSEVAFLQAHACDEAQGYFFSRPVVADAFAALLAAGPFDVGAAPRA